MTFAVPVGLYLLALVIRVVAAGQLPFPTTEPSAYYVDVAQNLLAGGGLVADGVWSYATPPLQVPKPAFELWQPMSTFVSAAAMSLLGSTFWAAQVGSAVLGAAVAPLAWAIGREAAHTQQLDGRRARAVAIAAGLLAAVLSPLVLGSIVPDSYTPFTVFVLAAAMLVPRVIGVREGRPDDRSASTLAGILLGITMGLAYLSRQEVIWLGLTVVLMLAWALQLRPRDTPRREALPRLWPVVAGGLLVVTPWLIRNALELGSPFPGQAIENMFLVDNEDIFAFTQRPAAATYLQQDLATLLGNPLAAAWDGMLNVIAIPAFPVGIAGLIALAGMRRAPALRRPTALVALLLSGALTFVSTVLLFPVASLWGTFLHASGPLLVGLAITAALGGDALLARISQFRDWERPNIVLAPAALVAMATLITVFSVWVFAGQSRESADRYATLGESLRSAASEAGQPLPDIVISDHPMWLADVIDGYAIALPDEDPAAIVELGRLFKASWVVVIDERGRYPDALLESSGKACLAADPRALETAGDDAWLFTLAEECDRP